MQSRSHEAPARPQRGAWHSFTHGAERGGYAIACVTTRALVVRPRARTSRQGSAHSNIRTLGVMVLQSMDTVALVHRREKTPGLFSAQIASTGTP